VISDRRFSPAIDMGQVVILGAGGFIGQHVRRAYETDGTDALWLVGRGPPRDGGPWRQIDLIDRQALSRFMKVARPDVVVNCAGRTVGSAEDLRRANVEIVSSVLTVLERMEMATRLVHIGSSAEYGDGTPGVLLAESAAPRPVSAYGRTKLMATEQVVGSNVDAVVLRVFNPVGPGAGPTSLIGHAVTVMRRALEVHAPQIEMGPLDAYRDFLHVADVADAVVLAGRTSPASGAVMNIGSGRATQARELVRLLADVAGFSGQIAERPGSPPRSAEVRWQQADVSQARLRLGWSGHRDLRSALAAAWHARSTISTAPFLGREPPLMDARR
jgi:nucleoside-diphosphate-sugar epimerase